MQTFFRFSPSPGRPPSERSVSSPGVEPQETAVSCPEQSVSEASASNTTTKMFEQIKSHMKGDRTSRMKSRTRHENLFLSQSLQSSTREEMRRKPKTGAGVQHTKQVLRAIAKRFKKAKREKERLSSVQQDTEMSQDDSDDSDGPETILDPLETEGSNEEPVECLTEEEVRAFALQRAENCARNRELLHKQGSRFRH